MKRNYQTDHIVVREREGRPRYGLHFDLDYPDDRRDQDDRRGKDDRRGRDDFREGRQDQDDRRNREERLIQGSRNPDGGDRQLFKGSGNSLRSAEQESPVFGSRLPEQTPLFGAPLPGPSSQRTLFAPPPPPMFVPDQETSLPTRAQPMVSRPVNVGPVPPPSFDSVIVPQHQRPVFFGAPSSSATSTSSLRISPQGGQNFGYSPNVQEALFSRPPQMLQNVSAPIEPIFGAPIPDVNWQQMLEREKLKEELFKQWQAGLIMPNNPLDVRAVPTQDYRPSMKPFGRDPLEDVGRGPQVPGNNDIMDGIMSLVMDRGLRNPSQSNIDFLRTPEMRGILRKIFSRELSSSARSRKDKEFIEQLKREIKGEPDIEEIVLSDDSDEIKKEPAFSDDAEIIDEPSHRRKKKKEKEKEKEEEKEKEKKKRKKKSHTKEREHDETMTRSRENAGKSSSHSKESETIAMPPGSKETPRRSSSGSPGPYKQSYTFHKGHRSDYPRYHHSSHHHYRGYVRGHHKKRSRSRSGSRDKSKKLSPEKSKDRNAHKRRTQSSERNNATTEKNYFQVQPPPESQQAAGPEKPTKLFASVAGFIDENSGILKVSSKGKKEGQLVFFHKDNLWVMSRNVYKNTVTVEKSVSPCALETIVPMGTGMAIYARELSGDVFPLQGTLVWPALANPPDVVPNIFGLDVQMDIFRSTFKLFNYEPLAFDGIIANSCEIWTCKVSELITDDWGLLELISIPKKNIRPSMRLFCIFHKSNIWLKNGTPFDQNNSDNIPLRGIVQLNQPVNLIARSIVKSKGADLSKTDSFGIHLQALVVALDPSCIPDGAPRGLVLQSGPETFGILQENSTSYLFDRSTIEKMSHQMVKFIKESRRQVKDVDSDCFPNFSQAPQESAKITLKSRLMNSIVRIKKLTSSQYGYMENLNQTWCCIFRVEDCQANSGEKVLIKENILVQMNANLVKESRKAQYMATSLWPIGKMTHQEDLNTELNADQLHTYSQVNNILEGRDPNILQEYFDNQEGVVCQVLDHTFGLIQFKKEYILFKVSEVWMSHESTAANRGLDVASVLPIGTKVLFNCIMLNSTADVKFMASAVWRAQPNTFQERKFPSPIRMSGMPKEKILEFRNKIDGLPLPSLPPLPLAPDLSKPPPMMMQNAGPHMVEGCVKISLKRTGEKILSGGIIEFCPEAGSRRTSLAIFSVKSFPVGFDLVGRELCLPKTRVLFQPVARTGEIQSDVTHIGTLVSKFGFPLAPTVNGCMEAGGREVLMHMKHRDLLDLAGTIKTVVEYGAADTSFYTLYGGLVGQITGSGRSMVRQVNSGIGILAAVLNENFGVIQFRTTENDTKYCLFDTFDLYTGINMKASDNNVPISSLLSHNEKVSFHAVELDPGSSVGWLATGVWKYMAYAPHVIEPDTITSRKIEIFRQVTESCKRIILSLQSCSNIANNPAFHARMKKLASCPVVFLRQSSIKAHQNLENLPYSSANIQREKGSAFEHSKNTPLLNIALPPKPLMPMSFPTPPKKVTESQSYNPLDSYTDYFARHPVNETGQSKKDSSGKKNPENTKVHTTKSRQREKELDEMKEEEFFISYKKSALENQSLTSLEEPDPFADISDGNWEDTLRKWKIQIVLWLKQHQEKPNQSDTDSRPNKLLPLSLNDTSTVGEIVEIFGPTTVVVKLIDIDSYVLVHTSRIWITDHKLFEGINYIKSRFKSRLRINARRVYITGKAKYQAIYAHVGLVPNKVGSYNISEKMQAFISKCQSLDALQSELEEYMRKKGEKQELEN